MNKSQPRPHLHAHSSIPLERLVGGSIKRLKVVCGRKDTPRDGFHFIGPVVTKLKVLLHNMYTNLTVHNIRKSAQM
jgi:hypothetical protein